MVRLRHEVKGCLKETFIMADRVCVSSCGERCTEGDNCSELFHMVRSNAPTSDCKRDMV